MRRDLVTFGDHALNNGRIWGCGVDGTFAKIVAGHEKCGMEAELFQGVQKLVCVKIRSVIVCQGYHVLLCAINDVVVI